MLLDVLTDNDVTAGIGNTERIIANHCRNCATGSGFKKKHHGKNALRRIVRSAEFRRLLIFRPFDAPGLFIIGAEYDFSIHHQILKHSATGSGRCFCTALLRVYGESMEFETRYCLIRAEKNNTTTAATEHVSEAVDFCHKGHQISALRLNDGKIVTLPATSCFLTKDRTYSNAPPLSAGLGAGQSLSSARQHAIAEIVEHDAVALWWYGGRQPRKIRFDAGCTHEHSMYRQSIRQDQSTRQEYLLDISTDLNVPCVASISFDSSGQTFACGSAARASYDEATKAAYREMCQMEYAHHLVREKINHDGLNNLSAVDREHVRRAALIKPGNFLLQPKLENTPNHHPPICNDTSETFIQTQLLNSGLQLLVADLSKKGKSVFVVKAIAPELQPLSQTVITQRLAQTITQTGGGQQYNHGVNP